MKLFDAHNHLQDERFAGRQAELWQEAEAAGVAAMVVNGSSENDWNDVAILSQIIPGVIASYGLHPWYVLSRSSNWLETLRMHIRENPDAAVGEIGLDRWKPDLPYDDQEDVFLAQWNLARDLNRPASIHCLKTWGRLLELVREHPAPARGFVLHSYGGPKEMINDFATLGAYFSFPGYYLHERKVKQRETFRQVPPERLLVETDAPDQPLPDELNRHTLLDPQGHPINHPANLRAVYEDLAAVLDKPVEELARQVEENFHRIFFTT
jgi:TatD DNase family protein